MIKSTLLLCLDEIQIKKKREQIESGCQRGGSLDNVGPRLGLEGVAEEEEGAQPGDEIGTFQEFSQEKEDQDGVEEVNQHVGD